MLRKQAVARVCMPSRQVLSVRAMSTTHKAAAEVAAYVNEEKVGHTYSWLTLSGPVVAQLSSPDRSPPGSAGPQGHPGVPPVLQAER